MNDDYFVEMVRRMVSATRATEEAEKAVDKTNADLRSALETLESRTRRIIAAGEEDPSVGYEVAFLAEALRDVEEADRRHEVAHDHMVAARKLSSLYEEVVEHLKKLRKEK